MRPGKIPLLQQDRITFLKQLPSTIRARTLYKAYKNRLGSFLEKEPVGLVVDDIQFVDSDLHALVEVCRILVMDYPGTTFHMAMSADIPCILFWRKEDWLFTEQADQVFEQLRRVGILHDTPEAAAKMVASAWSSVYSWWNSPVVRKARGAFNEMFARRTGKFHNEWAEIIRNH